MRCLETLAAPTTADWCGHNVTETENVPIPEDGTVGAAIENDG